MRFDTARALWRAERISLSSIRFYHEYVIDNVLHGYISCARSNGKPTKGVINTLSSIESLCHCLDVSSINGSTTTASSDDCKALIALTQAHLRLKELKLPKVSKLDEVVSDMSSLLSFNQRHVSVVDKNIHPSLARWKQRLSVSYDAEISVRYAWARRHGRALRNSIDPGVTTPMARLIQDLGAARRTVLVSLKPTNFHVASVHGVLGLLHGFKPSIQTVTAEQFLLLDHHKWVKDLVLLDQESADDLESVKTLYADADGELDLRATLDIVRSI